MENLDRMRTLTQRIYEWLDWDYPEEEPENDIEAGKEIERLVNLPPVVVEEQSK